MIPVTWAPIDAVRRISARLVFGTKAALRSSVISWKGAAQMTETQQSKQGTFEQAAEETKADLRHAGSDLKRRLTGLRQELKSEDSGAKASQSQSSQSS
jgi:hypothetical protein